MARKWLERLETVMDQRKLKAKPLSLRAGLNETYIRDLFGGTDPTVGKLEKIAKELELPMEFFFTESDSRHVPIISWISAGKADRSDDQDILGEISAPDLDPRGHWIALRVEGDSMDRISPPGSIIFVNTKDKVLVPNGCYVITDNDENGTYKRFRPNPERFEPVSTNPRHEPIFVENTPRIIGRVRKTILDM